MANICINKMTVISENEISKDMIEEIENIQSSNIYSIEKVSEMRGYVEFIIESKWNFPMEDFKGLFQKYNDESLYVRCLSEEYCEDLVSMNIFKNGVWLKPQYFIL